MVRNVRMMTAILFFGRTSEIESFNLDGEIILCRELAEKAKSTNPSSTQKYICDTGMTFYYNKDNVGTLRKEFFNHIGYDWIAKFADKLERYGSEDDRLALVFENKEVRMK